MKTKFIVLGAIAAALMAGTAMAETPATAMRPEASSTSTAKAYSGQWRLYKMIGLDVYNQNNEKLGDISELLVDQTGKIQTAILGVGGFLGVGERMVAVNFDQLKFVDQPVDHDRRRYHDRRSDHDTPGAKRQRTVVSRPCRDQPQRGPAQGAAPVRIQLIATAGAMQLQGGFQPGHRLAKHQARSDSDSRFSTLE